MNFTSSTTNNRTSTHLEIIITPLGRVLMVSVLAITTFAVFVGNVLVLAVLRKQKKTPNQSVITMFIANLSLIDLLVSLFVLPLSMTTYLYGRWPFGKEFCDVNGFTTMVIGLSGILTMTAIAVDRYRIIVLPVDRRLKTHQAWAILAFIWIWSFVQATPPLLGWNKYSFGQSSALCRASFMLQDGYIETLSVISYIIPLVVIIYCYVRVYLKVRQSRRKVEMWSQFTNNVWLRAEARTAKIVFTVLFVFIISWTPFVIVYSINGVGNTIVPLAAFRVTGWLASSHSALNPLIYLTMNERFRNDLRKLLKIREKNSHLNKGMAVIIYGNRKLVNGQRRIKEDG